MDDKLIVNLTLKEINLIMNALGNLPYIQVFELVENIRRQAQDQLKE